MPREYDHNENNQASDLNKSEGSELDAHQEADYSHRARACYELIYLLKQSRPHLRPQIECLEGVVTRAHHQLVSFQTVPLSATLSKPPHLSDLPISLERAIKRIETAYRCLLALDRK